MKLSGYSLALAVLTSGLNSSAGFVTPPSKNHNIAFASRSVAQNGRLFGIMDEVNSDAFNLFGGMSEEDKTSSKMTDAYEMFLAELVFSTNDPRMDIVDNADKALDDGFMKFLDNKINASTDVEEKMALGDLNEMIKDIKQKIELKQQQDLREQEEAEEKERQRIAEAEKAAAEGRTLSNSEVLKRAAAVDTADLRKEMGVSDDASEDVSGPVKKKTFYEAELSPEIRMSYEKVLKTLLPPYKPRETVQSVVKANYEQFDAQLVKVLTERVSNGDADSQAVLDALAVEQQHKVEIATEKLKTVLSAGDPMRMEGVIVKLAKEDKIDEAFLLLLEANADQARAAGAVGPADLMMKLRERAILEKDKQSTSKEIKLLRQLMRTENKEAREKLLEDAFTPRETFLVSIYDFP